MAVILNVILYISIDVIGISFIFIVILSIFISN